MRCAWSKVISVSNTWKTIQRFPTMGTCLVPSHTKQNPSHHHGYRPRTQLRFISSTLIWYEKEHPCHVGNCFDLLRVLPFLFFCWCHIPWYGVILFFLVLVQFCPWVYCHPGRPSLVPCRHNFLLMRISQVRIFFLAMTIFKFICTSALSSHEQIKVVLEES